MIKLLVAIITGAFLFGFAASARASVQTFALIVTNNRSADLDRPDLQYADDDGVRYRQFFGMATTPERVVLLTRLDRASARLYPDLESALRPPRREDILKVARSMGEQVAAAHEAGDKTVFYFVYAGHGRMQNGRGELELEDGRMDADFIERELLGRIAADERHIILDSCNSFFVLNPRKPGGRRWATPRDMALGFGERHPDVGLLLSTNSEAEVYEWSELESGVFSYEVRSGLSGAADVNGDGEVSYDELAGFIDRANASVPREHYRPQVFARGPRGDGTRSLFPWKSARGRRVALDATEKHVWVRSSDGARMLDLHQEATAVAFVVPATPRETFDVFEQIATPPQGRPTIRRYVAPPGEDSVAAAALGQQPITMAVRGDGVFRHLFANPYGPLAFRAYMATQAANEPSVYGITREDEARIRHYLLALSDIEKNNRLATGYEMLGLGTVGAAIGTALVLEDDPSRDRRPLGWMIGGMGLLAMGAGTYKLLTTTEGEDAYTDFTRRLELRPSDAAAIVADTELKLESIAERERRGRVVSATILIISGAVVGVATTAQLLDNSSSHSPIVYAGYGLTAFSFLGAYFIGTTPTPTERILHLYRQDPDLKLRFNVGMKPGAATVSLSGTF